MENYEVPISRDSKRLSNSKEYTQERKLQQVCKINEGSLRPARRIPQIHHSLQTYRILAFFGLKKPYETDALARGPTKEETLGPHI